MCFNHFHPNLQKKFTNIWYFHDEFFWKKYFHQIFQSYLFFWILLKCWHPEFANVTYNIFVLRKQIFVDWFKYFVKINVQQKICIRNEKCLFFGNSKWLLSEFQIYFAHIHDFFFIVSSRFFIIISFYFKISLLCKFTKHILKQRKFRSNHHFFENNQKNFLVFFDFWLQKFKLERTLNNLKMLMIFEILFQSVSMLKFSNLLFDKIMTLNENHVLVKIL
jgi:hypothetical protein